MNSDMKSIRITAIYGQSFEDRNTCPLWTLTWFRKALKRKLRDHGKEPRAVSIKRLSSVCTEQHSER